MKKWINVILGWFGYHLSRNPGPRMARKRLKDPSIKDENGVYND